MKLMNTKDLQKILADTEYFFEAEEEEVRAPCYRVNIDKDKEKFVFYIDKKEILAYPYEGFDLSCEPVLKTINEALVFLKSNNIKGLKRFLEMRKK